MVEDPDAAREHCHALFNNMALADVVMSADRLMREAPDGTVTTRKVAAELRLSDSVVRPVMGRLVSAHMLDELPKTGAGNGPRLFYRRNDDRWTALCALLATFRPRQTEPTPTVRRRPSGRS